ncbi:THO complex subunit 4 [Geosmithia morbida]|uniref:THO complex subunit 4 n=1 Tax=Geosmithia morbida TaxID=1094350 RepID=A0A9P4YZB4_9HYPO|nr:THO complex subunit 4 [Geosmithia morbida]KAF4125843.1 THO complex subunit 4 [Geosmithia morbida]
MHAALHLHRLPWLTVLLVRCLNNLSRSPFTGVLWLLEPDRSRRTRTRRGLSTQHFRFTNPCAHQEYFVQSVGPIKRVDISYGPNSQSRGVANVIFREADGASRAFQKLNGLLVDGRPIKIEIVVAAGQAEKIIPTVKTLAERTSQPRGQPKSAATDKKNNAPAKNAQKPAKKPRGRNARPAKKTAAELDSEMADYFDAAPANENAGAAPAVAAPAAAATPAPPPAANGEAMDDIEVCTTIV